MRIQHLIKTYPFTVAAFAAALVFCAATAFYNLPLSLGELGIVLILGAVAVLKNNGEFHKLRKTVTQLNTELTPADSGALSNFPLPILVFNAEEKILWYNAGFKNSVMPETVLQEKTIRQFTSGLGLEEIRARDSFPAKIGSREFTVYRSFIPNGEGMDYALYFVEDTALKEISLKYKMSKAAVIFIAMDSIEEIYRSYKESEYAEITGGIERIMEKWFSEYSCLFRKLGSGRFLAIAEERKVREMTEARFNVLERVRAYTYNDNPVGVSLSIGVGRGETITEAESAARQALDMALGRGGDQAAVRASDGYRFFGGVSGGVEKRTRVRSRIIASAISEMISSSTNVLIMGHKFSDLDALGAAVGIQKIAESLGKNAKIVLSRKTTLAGALVRMLDEKKRADIFIAPESAELILERKTLLVIVDTLRPDFLESKALYEKAQTVVVIDHHRKTVDYIQNAVIFHHEPYASSASEMVTELSQYISAKPMIGPIEANALLSGIMLDTKNFVLRTGVRTFEAAAYLKSRGADTVAVKQLFSNSMETQQLRSEVISEARMYEDCAIAVADVQSENLRIIAAQAADELLSVSGVKSSFVLFKTGETVNISARSMGEMNVQIIMETLGGGGHRTMAAAQIENSTVEEGIEKLKSAIDLFYQNNQ